jgi:hypothetical protein
LSLELLKASLAHMKVTNREKYIVCSSHGDRTYPMIPKRPAHLPPLAPPLHPVVDHAHYSSLRLLEIPDHIGFHRRFDHQLWRDARHRQVHRALPPLPPPSPTTAAILTLPLAKQYHSEGRPSEGGRSVICRRSREGGEAKDVFGRDYNARG